MSYFADDRPTGEYESAMTAGAAWPDVTPLELAEWVVYSKRMAAWGAEAFESTAYWRREIYDTFIEGEGFGAIHDRADKLLRASREIEDGTAAEARAWSAAEAIVNRAKEDVLRVVEKGLKAIRQVNQNTKSTSDQKNAAIASIIAEAHAENVETVAAAAESLPEYPSGELFTPITGYGGSSLGSASKPSMGNGGGPIHATPMGNEKGNRRGDDRGDTNSKENSNKENRRGDDRPDAKDDDKAHRKEDTKERRGDDRPDSHEDVPAKEIRADDRPSSPSTSTPPITQVPQGNSSAMPMAGAGTGGGGAPSGSPGSSLGSLGKGGMQGSPAAASNSPAVTPASSLSPSSLSQPPLDPGPRTASSMSGSTTPPPITHGPLPVTAATNSTPPPATPPPIAQPAAPAPAQAQPVATPMQAGTPMPPGMMGPPPTATPLGGPAAPASLTAGAAPAAPTGGGGSGPGTTASVIPVSASERIRQHVLKATRQSVGDVAGEARRLAAALTASSRKRPDLQWCVGGCPDDGTGPLTIVASNVGLGFLPAKTELPRHTAVHVFAESPGISWGLKRAWLGNPVAAVIGYGRAIGRPVTVVAGLAMVVADVEGVGVEIVTEESIPMMGVIGGRKRLEVIDPDFAEKISGMGTAGLAEMLPTTDEFALEPDNKRTQNLWTDAVLASDIDDIHQLKTWQAFCADQAAVSAYRVTHTTDRDKSHEYFQDYKYFAWNLEQVEAAFADIRATAQQRNNNTEETM